MKDMSAAHIENFWKKVNKDGPMPDQQKHYYLGLGQCWNWTGRKTKDGYGIQKINKLCYRAHRVSVVINKNVDLSKSDVITHKCDNPLCVNPEHLLIGTHKSNADDRQEKGRGNQMSGENHYYRKFPERIPRGDAAAIKLTSVKVAEMREKYQAGGTSTPKLAREYGVSKSTAWNIVNFHSWKSQPQAIAAS